MDVLRNQIVERKVIDLILEHATFKEVPYELGRDRRGGHRPGGRRRRAIATSPRPSTTKAKKCPKRKARSRGGTRARDRDANRGLQTATMIRRSAVRICRIPDLR